MGIMNDHAMARKAERARAAFWESFPQQLAEAQALDRLDRLHPSFTLSTPFVLLCTNPTCPCQELEE